MNNIFAKLNDGTLNGEGVCKLDNLFHIRSLYIMQINMFKLNSMVQSLSSSQ